MGSRGIAILTDTGTNTPRSFIMAHDVREVALRINLSDGSSLRSGADIASDQMAALLAQEIPTTSLPSPDEIRTALERVRDDGYEGAIFVTIAAGLSATNHTVRLMADRMEGFPVAAIDSRSIGIAAGMVTIAAVEMAEAGAPFDTLVASLDKLSRDTRVFFSTKTLEYLRKGGRISEAVYRLGSFLRINPVITCDRNGRYTVARRVRGWERSLDAEVSLVLEHAQGLGRPVRLAICCSAGNDHFDGLEGKLRKGLAEYGIEVAGEVLRSGVSPDLLVHTGPDLVGIGVQPRWERAW
ncbi:DegV family protein [Coriobacteriales bacterium OH1046]|nr:DegV family protein [Coriobacteriales bacterium OH1046]